MRHPVVLKMKIHYSLVLVCKNIYFWHFTWKTQILMLYSEESEVWIPESKEFCLICFNVGGGLLSCKPSTRLHEHGKDSGPFECVVALWFEPRKY